MAVGSTTGRRRSRMCTLGEGTRPKICSSRPKLKTKQFLQSSFSRKCPSAPRDFRWMRLFPSESLSRDPADGRLKRYHCDDDHQRRIFRDAVLRSGVRRRITQHDIRRAAATHLHQSGMPLIRLQAILVHNSLEMTQLSILEDEAQINGSHSPFDQLDGLQCNFRLQALARLRITSSATDGDELPDDRSTFLRRC